MQNTTRVVVYNQNRQFVAAEKRRREKIRGDPILSANYESPTPKHPDTVDFRAEAKEILKCVKKNEKSRGTRRRNLTQFSMDAQQTMGKKKRIQITPNITGNPNELIPVYCDVSKSPRGCEIPSTLNFEYSDKNVCTQLGRLEGGLQKDRYKNKCDCHDRNPPVKCWENADCPCYQRNKGLRVFQKNGGVASRNMVKFSSFDPLHLNPLMSSYTIGYACSEECSCRGECGNNATLLLDKKLNSLVLERKTMDLGFQVGSLNFLPKGTVIAAMTGEILDDESMDEANGNYSFNINYGDEGGFQNNPCGRIRNASNRLKTMMKGVYEKSWNIDTTNVGNVGRMLNHSCEPNVDTVRVFQKGLSPSNIRLLLVTIRPVFPGDQLTIDYGPNYEFENGCKCGTMSCVNTKVGRMSEQEMEKMLRDDYTRKYNFYNQEILSKVTAT